MAASTTFTSKLKEKETLAEGTMGFYFAKPEGFQFKPGQYLGITLVDPPETDAEGNIRSLSIASAPEDEHLLVATRMRDTAFKRVLRMAPFGLEVNMEGPMGSFTLHNNSAKPAVFLAGGIGSRHSPASSVTQLTPNFRISSISFIPTGGQKMLLSCQSCKSWKEKILTLNLFPA